MLSLRPAVLLFVAATTTLVSLPWASPPSVSAQCEFRLGFKAVYDLIPAIVGECVTDELHNPENGDGLQVTTNGLMVWRKSDNWTAFTNGSTTWINGPLGLQSRPNSERFAWEGDLTPSLPASIPVPAGADALIQQVIADATRRSGVDISRIRVVSVEPREWRDASLGCPEPDRMYAQVITPGFLIVLDAGGQRLEYHTDLRQTVKLC